MLGFQNGTHLDRKLSNVEFFYNLGIRMMLLTYNELNALGAGCTERHDTGLSHFGVDVVKKMNELGMIVDLAHCGKKTSLGKAGPVFPQQLPGVERQSALQG